MIFKVLKKYGDYKKGEVFDSEEADLDQNDIDEAIADGFIAEDVADGVVNAPAPVEEKPKADKKAKAESVLVEFYGGIREFTLAIHGENFMDVAKEFATTHNGTIK